ncbi:MAG: hypothetical protein K0S09_1053 [Sphingobacteriaceae bacterium]|jgi:hypothetical protein|nr:hypothetical protein [Sphingobacteriaceae bacterium]
MKKLIIASFATCTILLASCDTLNQAAQVLNQSGIGIPGVSPTSSEVSLGLKQALEFGTTMSAERLSARDGFLGNLAIKLLFPPEAQKVERTLRGLGFNQLCDNVVMSLNRAAEDAAAKAKPIFVSAIKQMTINDAMNILLGNQSDAATQYFKRVTTSQLMSAFSPVIQNSLGKVGATKYWGDVTNTYNKLPLVTKINPDLTGYVTERAIEGLFFEIAKEELRIRSNVSARTTPLLQKVFGYADQNRG